VSHVITKQALQATLAERVNQGHEIVGPVQLTPGLYIYQQLASPEQLALDGYIRPRNSIKDYFFPRHEVLFSYRVSAHDVELRDPEMHEQPRIFVGARPCDAAALPILDHVFNWDVRDASYNRYRESTTVVSLACTTHDAECFCTTVGLGPASDKGSDAMLLPLGGDTYEVRSFTEKGHALFDGRVEVSDRIAEIGAGPERKVDLESVAAFVKDHFEHAIWNETSLRCLSCGACAYTCPTCHCFDLVDEGNALGGCRVRNWDSCQFCQFTAHASGHNPRSNQSQRQRQRVFHKFHMYPERFGEFLCTGCGNCTRNCPAGLGILGTLQQLQRPAING